MNDYVLVIVDVQPGQDAASDPVLLRAISREVDRAIAAGQPIVVLEFPDPRLLDMVRSYAESSGKRLPIGRAPVERPLTYPEVMDRLKDYDRVAVRNKFDFDGSMEVLYACHDLGWQRNAFRIVGVYTFCCVAATANGLYENDSRRRIEIIKDACGHDRDASAWSTFHAGIALVPGEVR